MYLDLKYNEISLNFTDGSVCLCGVCSHVVVIGLVICVPYVGAVAGVTYMRVLLFVLHVSMVRESGGESVTEMVVWRMGEVWFR